MTFDVHIASRTPDLLGEGPVWLAERRRLLRVDIDGQVIVERDVRTGTERRRRTSGRVGFALPAAGGGLVAGVGLELVRLADLDAAAERLGAIDEPAGANRFNDAACDPTGRLWAGTMSLERAPGTAALYRIEPCGAATVALADVTISNGLDWNLDATRLYYVDSVTQRIDAIDFDVDRGRLGRRRRFAAVAPADGLPDGLCVDAEGGVWVALFGGGAIRRYRPDGALDAHIALPVSCPTSLAFGGDELTDLYVTSSRHRLSVEQRRREPAAGSLLTLEPGVRGRLPHEFGT